MYSIETTRQARKDLRNLPRAAALPILIKLEKVAQDPFRPNNNVKTLAGDEGYRLRVGDYRAVYFLRENILTLVLVRVKHRKEVYR